MRDIRTTQTYAKIYNSVYSFVYEAIERLRHVKNMLELCWVALTSNNKDFSYVICKGFHDQYVDAYGRDGIRDPYKHTLR